MQERNASQDLIGSAEAAALLHVPVRRVQRWAREGKLRYVRQLPGPTGAYLFDRGELTGQGSERH